VELGLGVELVLGVGLGLGVELGSGVEVDGDGSGVTAEGTGVDLGVTLAGTEEVVVLEVLLPLSLQSSGLH